MTNTKPHAYFVVGAESSGTRIMTRIMIANGCAGSAEHEQPFDNGMPHGFSTYEPVVWRRSYPHGGERPEIHHCIERLQNYDYAPHVIITMRDFNAMAHSQVNANHFATIDEAHANISEAYKEIFDGVRWTGVPYYVVGFEALGWHPAFTLAGLARHFGIAPLEHPPITNQNSKYF